MLAAPQAPARCRTSRPKRGSVSRTTIAPSSSAPSSWRIGGRENDSPEGSLQMQPRCAGYLFSQREESSARFERRRKSCITVGLDIGVYACIMSVYAPIVKRNLLMPSESSARWPECNCLALRQAARHVSQFYDQYLASTGLRTTQFSILAKLKGLGPMTINTLARELVMDRTTLGRTMLPLERDGLIAIKDGILDRNEAVDRKSTRLNSSHGYISYAVFCLKKKKAMIS